MIRPVVKNSDNTVKILEYVSLTGEYKYDSSRDYHYETLEFDVDGDNLHWCINTESREYGIDIDNEIFMLQENETIQHFLNRIGEDKLNKERIKYYNLKVNGAIDRL